MAKYIWHDGQWCEAVRISRRSVAPAIHRDGMSFGYHPGSGMPTDSKGKWRAWNREHGYTEMGTDAPTEATRQHTPAIRKQDIADAIGQLRAGYRPDPLPMLSEGEFAGAEVRA